MAFRSNQTQLFKRYWGLSRNVNDDGKDSVCPRCGAVTKMLVEECAGNIRVLREVCVNLWTCGWERKKLNDARRA
jgi:hypothetical protein